MKESWLGEIGLIFTTRPAKIDLREPKVFGG
jgi:hypothetical protein